MTPTKNAETELIDLFKQRDALLEGHFVLSSGLHSNRYFQSALLLQDPKLSEDLGKMIAKKFKSPISVVVSPAIGGIVIGQEVARAIGCRALFVEKDEQGKPVLRRNFQLKSAENVLVIEDVITTGLSTAEVLTLVEKLGARPIGVGSIVNRGGEKNEKLLRWTLPIESLLVLDVQSWDPSVCPLCKDGLPAVKPGSRKK